MHCGNQSGMATLLQQKSFMKTVTNVVVNGTDNGQAGASATIVASSTVSAAAAVPNGGVASANHPAQTFLPVTAKPANHQQQQQMHHHQPPALIAVSSTVPPLSGTGVSSSSTCAATTNSTTTTTTIINANSTQQLHKHPPLLQQIFIQKNHQTSMVGGGVGQTTGVILVPASMEASASGTSFAGRTFAGRTILRAPGAATTISLASVAQGPQIDGSFRQQHIMNAATTTGSTHPISDVLTTTTTATPSCPVNNTVVPLQTVNGGIHSQPQQQQQPQQSGDGFVGSSSMVPPHANQQQSPSTCADTPVADNTTSEATTVAVAGDSQDTKETIPDEGEQEAEPEIDIVINNVVCSFSVRCHLNLRNIAMNGYNVEFRRENGMMTMKLRRPYTTASIWSSGKITCTGATSEDQAKVAARRYSRCLQNLGYNVRLRNFRIVNVLGTCSMPWGIMIVNFSERYRKEASYEPELHPGVTYKLLKPKATLKIFSTGSITVTAASVAFVQEAIEHIYPRVYEFRKKRTPLEKQQLLKPPVIDVQDTDHLIEEDAGGDIEMLDAMDGTEAPDSSGAAADVFESFAGIADTVPNKYSTKAIQKSSSSRVNTGLERQRIRRHRPPGREAMYSDPMTDDDDDDANVSEI